MNKIAAAASEASNFVRAWQLLRYAASLHPPHFSRSLSSEPLLESGLDEAQECEGSITVSYLVNSCGFSAEKALTLSKKVSFETTERPDSVLGLLRDHGFADSEISKLVSKVPRLLLADPEKILLPKLEFLRSLGLQARALLSPSVGTVTPESVCQKPDDFNKDVEKVVGMGFTPKTLTFVNGLHVIATITKSTWVHKLEVYKSCGWTEEEILLAFRKKPTCMCLSEKNIRSKMDFLVNKMGWQPAYLARYPDFLSLSLERRIIPRCSVIRVLLVKGLLKKKYSISSLLITIDSCFISKFVTRYQGSVPQLLDIFRGKLSLQELGFQFEGK
ncbi:transcription termination factor MTEF1, chloroplastic-like [Pyrus communis]|uniref:transcription termination factor MTEF1, chloroplastic-like n=1 Tax=Pyrus communis TaxID=23211 RepID=UPI0035C122FF